MVKDFLVKEFILQNNLMPLYKKARRDGYLMEEFIALYGWDVWRVCRNMLKGGNKKRRRLSLKVDNMIESGPVSFLTLTFRDDVLAKTSEVTRRRYVARYLKSQSDTYVANIDYGKTTEREHYHAIVLGYVDLDAWAYGFPFAEKVHSNTKDAKKVSAYVCKLSNHCFKESTTNGCLDAPPRFIYSKHFYG